MIKVRNIILEFQSTLNYDYPVAQDFNNVYEYLKFRLTEANLHKEPEIMEEILRTSSNHERYMERGHGTQ